MENLVRNVEDSIRNWGDEENVDVERVIIAFRPQGETYDEVWSESGRSDVREIDPDLLQAIRMSQMGVGGGIAKVQQGRVLIETWKHKTVAEDDCFEGGFLAVKYNDGFGGFSGDSFGNQDDVDQGQKPGQGGLVELKAKLLSLSTFMANKVRVASSIDGDADTRKISGAFKACLVGGTEVDLGALCGKLSGAAEAGP